MSEEERDIQEEQELIVGFLQWARVNGIRVERYSYGEIYEYMCRYLKAAG